MDPLQAVFGGLIAGCTAFLLFSAGVVVLVGLVAVVVGVGVGWAAACWWVRTVEHDRLRTRRHRQVTR